MTDHDQKIRERAYALWEADGGRHGFHEAHWLQAEQELGNAAPQLSSDQSDAETAGLGPEAPQSGIEEQQTPPPGRSGQSQSAQNPVEAADESNPTHHKGRIPTSPLTK